LNLYAILHLPFYLQPAVQCCCILCRLLNNSWGWFIESI